MTTDTKLTTPLAAELMRLRQKYIAEGGKLFTLDEIEAELGRSLATAPTNAAPQEGQSGNWPLGQSGTPTNAAPPSGGSHDHRHTERSGEAAARTTRRT